VIALWIGPSAFDGCWTSVGKTSSLSELARERRRCGQGKAIDSRALIASNVCGADSSFSAISIIGALVVAITAMMPVFSAVAITADNGAQPGKSGTSFTTPDITSSSSDRAKKVGEALQKRRAILFGTYWCPYCNDERETLGKDVFQSSGSDAPLVRYVECDARGTNAQPDLCSTVGVTSYPTWALSASPDADKQDQVFKLFTGRKGLSGLEQLTGLPTPPDPNAVAPPVVTTSGAREIAVATKLQDSGATMYGAFWCGYCDKQKQLLGKEAWSKVSYVECDPRSPNAEPEKCRAAGVHAYPEWVFPGNRHVGGMLPLDALEMRADSPPSLSEPVPGGGAAVQVQLPSSDDSCTDCKIDGTKTAIG